MPESFFVREDGLFIPTEWTIGPWDPGAQHAGPPAALTASVIEQLPGGDGMPVSRFTFEILRPVPVSPLGIATRVVRAGKRVQFVEALMTAGDTEIARGSAWRIRSTPGSVTPTPVEPPPFPGPEESQPLQVFDPGLERSYFRGMEWRFASGAFFEPGPAAAWMRMRHPLVAGEPTSPLARVLAAADSGNGISSVVDISEHLFINTELTVHVTRGPVSEWVAIDAASRVDAGGVGHASSVLWDERGRIGTGNQILLVASR